MVILFGFSERRGYSGQRLDSISHHRMELVDVCLDVLVLRILLPFLFVEKHVHVTTRYHLKKLLVTQVVVSSSLPLIDQILHHLFPF